LDAQSDAAEAQRLNRLRTRAGEAVLLRHAAHLGQLLRTGETLVDLLPCEVAGGGRQCAHAGKHAAARREQGSSNGMREIGVQYHVIPRWEGPKGT
jgi:hypothetical protein